MVSRESVRRQLLAMAHELGDGRHMAILGEGNVSGNVKGGTFLVKASGSQLWSLTSEELVEVDGASLRVLLATEKNTGDQVVEQFLLDARTDSSALKPSVETLFHAWLLHLPGIQVVGHVHATCVNQVLCSPQKEAFARRRIIPDQVVYCGAESPLVPYTDPGLALARRIMEETEAFRERTRGYPRIILLENHGIIALGAHPAEVTAALAMAEKAARIFVGAATLGGPIFMEEEEVVRIAARRDEHYRQRMLRRKPPAV